MEQVDSCYNDNILVCVKILLLSLKGSLFATEGSGLVLQTNIYPPFTSTVKNLIAYMRDIVYSMNTTHIGVLLNISSVCEDRTVIIL